MKNRAFFSNQPSTLKTKTRPITLIKVLSQHFEIPDLEEIEESPDYSEPSNVTSFSSKDLGDEPFEDTEGNLADEPFEDPEENSTDVPFEDSEGISTDVPFEDSEGISPDVPLEDSEGIPTDVPLEKEPSVQPFLRQRYTSMIISGNTQILSDFISQYKSTKNVEKLAYLFKTNFELAKWISSKDNIKFMLEIPLEIWEIIDEVLV